MNGKRPGGWFAVAVRYYRDPKFGRVSDAAELLYLRALAYSAEHETDGGVQRVMLGHIRPRARVRVMELAEQLVGAGLWIETADGYAVPFDTWSRWQETAEQKAAARTRDAERKAQWRQSRRGTGTSRDGGTSQSVPGHQGQWYAQRQVAPTELPPAAIAGERTAELYTDDDGNLFVRHITNGQADPPMGEP